MGKSGNLEPWAGHLEIWKSRALGLESGNLQPCGWTFGHWKSRVVGLDLWKSENIENS